MFDFNTQLKVGETGEKFFFKCYADKRPRMADSRKFDMFIEDDKTVELKTDTYPMIKTPNFFMEQYGNLASIPGSLGGPWRAKRDGVDHFVYHFTSDNVFFWFDPNTLCNFFNFVIFFILVQKISKNSMCFCICWVCGYH